MLMTANVLILSAAGMLVSAYLMVGQKALFTTIRLYGLQSLLLAIVATTIAISESRPELFVTAALTVVLKTILIPWFLMRTVDRIGIHREIEPFLNVPVSLLICLGLTVVGYRVSTGFEEGAQQVTHHLIGVALSLLLIGLFLMVTRKKAITQILALLTVENAVFLVAVGVTTGMPLIVELGIAFDVMLAVLVLGILVQRIVGRFESMDVSRLSNLKG
ncbi:MAG: hydrogenase [Vicinamibacterales bacterium]